MKQKLLEKIYRQIFECENQIKSYNDMKYDIEFPCAIEKDKGKKEELGENIIFCYDLIDIILREEK
ncbi:MAG: hypothetical protein EOL97_13795 [Spirochaetia bacterium]|nr:hypothetical protein [Spirochaetia bacterium]